MVADKIFDRPGVYSSPNGTRIVRIRETTEGLRCKPVRGSLSCPAYPFPADSDWLMCFDDKDRLWIYIPDHPVHCSFPGGVGAPGVGGGWDGVPGAFFDRLPPNIQATRIESAPAVPQE